MTAEMWSRYRLRLISFGEPMELLALGPGPTGRIQPLQPGGTAWASGDDAFFTATSSVTFATTAVSDVTVSNGSTVTVGQAGTLTLAGVRTFDIDTGSTLTWTNQTWSSAAGNEGSGIIKNGAGTLEFRRY